LIILPVFDIIFLRNEENMKTKVTIKDFIPVTIMILIFIVTVLIGDYIVSNIDFTSIAKTLKG
jgi:hypothetical protein